MNTSDLISVLRSVPELVELVGQKIHDSRVPTKQAGNGAVVIDSPYVWVQKRGEIRIETNQITPGTQPNALTFDVECIANSPAEANEIRDKVALANGYSGPMDEFSDAWSNAIDMRDQPDDYVPVNQAADEGLFVSSFFVTVWGC